jgi:hypothetical protein
MLVPFRLTVLGLLIMSNRSARSSAFCNQIILHLKLRFLMLILSAFSLIAMAAAAFRSGIPLEAREAVPKTSRITLIHKNPHLHEAVVIREICGVLV